MKNRAIKFLLFCATLLLSLSVGACAAGKHYGSDNHSGKTPKIIDNHSGKEISLAELARKLKRADNIVIGELHENAAVQNMEAEIIKATVAAAGNQGSFAVGWEFTDVQDKTNTDSAFLEFAGGQIDAVELLRRIHGSDYYRGYIPILETIKDLRGNFLSVNLSRNAKRPVVVGGLNSLDPNLLPPGFALGNDNYHERFVAVMRHGANMEEAVNRYYAAQCLTDDVMAYYLLGSQAKQKFLVTGSFHADYYGGVVGRLKIRAPKQETVSIIFLDTMLLSNMYRAAGLSAVLHHYKYGSLADYVVLVD